MQVWDSAGQERFRTITQTYYQNALGIILSYDITNETSFMNVSNWMKQIKEHAKSDVSIVLVGNKLDCEDRQISYMRGFELASENKIAFFETSALTGQNVEKAFEHIAQMMLEVLIKRE